MHAVIKNCQLEVEVKLCQNLGGEGGSCVLYMYRQSELLTWYSKLINTWMHGLHDTFSNTGAEEAHFKWSGHSMTNLKWSGHLAKMVVLISMQSRRLLKSGQAIA